MKRCESCGVWHRDRDFEGSTCVYCRAAEQLGAFGVTDSTLDGLDSW